KSRVPERRKKVRRVQKKTHIRPQCRILRKQYKLCPPFCPCKDRTEPLQDLPAAQKGVCHQNKEGEHHQKQRKNQKYPCRNFYSPIALPSAFSLSLFSHPFSAYILCRYHFQAKLLL